MPPEPQWQSSYRRWLDWTAPAGLGLLLMASWIPLWGMVAGFIFHGIAASILWRTKPHSTTPADRITLARGVGILLLYAGALLHTNGFLLLALAALLAATDLVDGWIARRAGATEFGAVLDMEMDQFMVLTLSLMAMYLAGLPGWMILFPGLRYLNLVALRVCQLPRLDPKPKEGDNRRARLICAIVIVVLLSNLVPLDVGLPRLLLNALALALLVWSFADDFIYIFSRSRLRPQA